MKSHKFQGFIISHGLLNIRNRVSANGILSGDVSTPFGGNFRAVG